jgi:hypothetical protein
MNKRSIALVFLLLTASVSPSAQADEQSYRKAVEEYFTIAKMDTIMQRSIDVALGAQIRANPTLKQFEPKLRQFFTKYMGWKSL